METSAGRLSKKKNINVAVATKIIKNANKNPKKNKRLSGLAKTK